MREKDFLFSQRQNQDEMGTRQKCEQVARSALKKGQSVIVDRCNFDYRQRHNWIKIAAEFRVTDIRYPNSPVFLRQHVVAFISILLQMSVRVE